MTDLWQRPPEHDLPPDRAADIRRVVMSSAGDAHRRRSGRRAWLLVPIVAALAVVALVIGLRSAQAPVVLGSPSPAPSVTSTRPADGAVDTDAGPLSEADAVAAVDRVLSRPAADKQAPLVDVLVARRTTTALGDGTFVMWTDTTGSTWWAADIPQVMGSWGPVSGPAAKKATRTPDDTHPVVRLTDLEMFGWRMDADRPDATARDLHSGNFYRVSGSVDRVEVRMTVEGKAGPWFSAPAHNGYAFVPAVTPGAHSTTEDVDKVTKVEDRAFDHDGKLTPIAGS